MKIRELWQELDDQQAEKLSGGAEGCLAWSIGFSDVVRPSTSQAPSSITFHIHRSSLYESSIVPAAKISRT